MTSVLLVIAGLVVSPAFKADKIDAISSASKNANKRLFAHTTSEIAFSVKELLEKNGITADIMVADSRKTDLEKYDMVILGSGIYGMTPHISIKRFIQKNADGLKKKKTATFVVCGIICSDSEENKVGAMKLVDKMQLGFSPVSKAAFRGKVLDYGPFFNWIGKQFLRTFPPGDYRQWDVIEKWTIGLVNDLST